MDGQRKLENDKRELFCQEYLTDLNAKQAAIRAGYSPKTAEMQGSRLLSYDEVKARVAFLAADRVDRLRIKADDLLIRAETILKADPRELTEHRIGACRFCWGIDHQYQWKTRREFREALDRATTKLPKKPSVAQRNLLPTDEGGFGYKITEKPNPDCPECSGLGVPFTRFADTRGLSAEATLLFEGVKEGRDGIEFKMASKEKAFETLAKHHGLAIEKHEHTGKDGKPIEVSVKARVVIVPPKAEAPVETRPIQKDDGGAAP